MTNRQWNESDITWDTQPYGTNGYTSTDHECQYYEFEMTEFVRGWHNGSIPNYGVDFTYTNETHNDYNSAYSSEGNSSKAPKLEITYTIAGETEEDEYAAMNWSYLRSKWIPMYFFLWEP